MVEEGLMEKVVFRGVRHAAIWERVFHTERTASAKSIRKS